MTTKTQTPHQLARQVFHGYCSRSWHGMRLELMNLDRTEEEANELICFWITHGMIWGNEIEDDHFILRPKKMKIKKGDIIKVNVKCNIRLEMICVELECINNRGKKKHFFDNENGKDYYLSNDYISKHKIS